MRRSQDRKQSRVEVIKIVKRGSNKLPYGLVKDLCNQYYQYGVGLGALLTTLDLIERYPEIVRKKREERITGSRVAGSGDEDRSLDDDSSDDDFVRPASGPSGPRRPPQVVIVGRSGSGRPQPQYRPPPPPPGQQQPPPRPAGVNILHTGPGPGEHGTGNPIPDYHLPPRPPAGPDVPVMLHTDPGPHGPEFSARRPSRYQSGPQERIYVRRPSQREYINVESRERQRSRPTEGVHRASSESRRRAQTVRMKSRISAVEAGPTAGDLESEDDGVYSVQKGEVKQRHIKVFFGFLKDGDFTVQEKDYWRFRTRTMSDEDFVRRMQSSYESMKYFRGWVSLKSIGFAHLVRWEHFTARSGTERGWIATAKLGIFDYEDSRSTSIFRNRVEVLRGHQMTGNRMWLDRLDELAEEAGRDVYITVHLEELPAYMKIFGWLVVAILISTGAGVLYALEKGGDWATGISLSSYAITCFGFTIAVVALGDHVGLATPGSGLSKGEDWVFDIPTERLTTGSRLEQLKEKLEDRKKKEIEDVVV